jgi:hypothetical protein
VKQSNMEPSAPPADALLKLADNLHELEVVIGESARPVVAAVRMQLVEAAGKRSGGDIAGALSSIREAMEKLAALGSRLDPAEGRMMRLVAERFTRALGEGDKGTAKEVVNVMRHKAGDTKDDENTEW